jgi:hypothetical protein
MGVIDKIKARWAKASPRPWKLIEVLGGISVHAGTVTLLNYYSPVDTSKNNAKAIAHAPTDIAFLLSIAEAAEKYIVEHDKRFTSTKINANELTAARDELRAALRGEGQ